MYFYGEEPRRFTGEEGEQVSVLYGQDATAISVRDGAAFDSRYFRLTRQEEGENGGGLTGTVRYYDGQVSGSLTNQLEYDLEGVAVILYGRLTPVGDMKAGETVELGLTIDERLADGYYYSKSVRLLKKLLECPELLERPMTEEVDY